MRQICSAGGLLACAWTLALAGCSSPEPAAVDAGTTDATVDEEPDAAPPAPVTVTVTDDLGSPVPDATLLFLDVDDTLVAQLETDADGAAAVTVPDGGSVVLVTTGGGISLLGPGQLDIYAILDVHPGEDLTFLTAPSAAPWEPQTVTFTLPARANATSYHLALGCSTGATNTNTTTLVTDLYDCGPEADVTVVALDDSGPIGWFTSHVVFGPSVSLTANTYQALSTVSMTVDNLPASIYSADLHVGPLAPSLTTLATEVDPTDGTVSVSGSLTVGPSDDVITSVNAQRAGFPSQILFDTGVSGRTIDATTMLQPWSSRPVTDLEGSRLVWSRIGAGITDVVTAEIYVYGSGPHFTGPGGGSARIHVSGPPHEGSLRIPRLPAAFGVEITGASNVSVSSATAFHNFPTARSRPFWSFPVEDLKEPGARGMAMLAGGG